MVRRTRPVSVFSTNATPFPASSRTAKNIVCISAKTGEGTAELLSVLSKLLESGKKTVELLLPYAQAGVLEFLHREGSVLSSEYGENGITVKAVIRPELWGRVRDFVINGAD